MKLICNRMSLLIALGLTANVAKASCKKSRSGVLLSAKPGRLRLRSGNLKLAIDQTIAAEVDAEWEMLVPALVGVCLRPESELCT